MKKSTNLFDLGDGYGHIHSNLAQWENGFQINYFVSKIFQDNNIINISEIPFLFSDGINVNDEYLIELKSHKKSLTDDEISNQLKPLAEIFKRNFINDKIDIKFVTKNKSENNSQYLEIEGIVFNMEYENFNFTPSKKIETRGNEIKMEFIKTIFKIFAVEFILFLKRKNFKENELDLFLEAKSFLLKNEEIFSEDSIRHYMKLSKNVDKRNNNIKKIAESVFDEYKNTIYFDDIIAILYYSIEMIAKYANKRIDNKNLIREIVLTAYKVNKQDNESEDFIIEVNYELIETVVSRSDKIKNKFMKVGMKW